MFDLHFLKFKNFQSSFLLLLFLLLSVSCFSQVEYSGKVNLHGMSGTDDELPFWMHSNQRGRVSKETNFLGLLSGKAVHQLSSTSWLEAEGGVFFDDQRDLKLDELYISFRNPWMKAVVGRKQREELYSGLSSSNENILRSLNARPLPGFEVGTAAPIFLLPKIGLGVEAFWEEYLLEKQRHVSNARLHHKGFHLVYQPVENFQLKAGLQHYVQWAGTSADRGIQPATFTDYIRVLIGYSGGEGATLGDKQNALGNNLGSYEIYLNTRVDNYYVSLFYNHIFEDGSGRRLGNTPDGRYGLYIQDESQEGWVHSFMYEFYYTKHQSHTTSGTHKFDNYFNNGVYRSGWTYGGQVIGTPFFMTRENGMGIISNRLIVHHLGIGGVAFNSFPFKFINSYRKNYGTNGSGLYSETQNIMSSLLEFKLVLRHFDLDFQLGSDFSSDAGPRFGAGFGLSYML